MNNKMDTVVIFGGTDFIGTHLAQQWLRERLAQKVILVDLLPPRVAPYTAELQAALNDGRADFVEGDIRDPIAAEQLPQKVDLIFNLAAVHREPGPQPYEYFETNLHGAENVCAWATAVNCKRIVFTSSISPCGPSEDLKNEKSEPVPETPYGSSKLAAEKIHQRWQSACLQRKLLIVRLGVVFGPGEGGNVTRLIRSLVGGDFVYMGNRKTRKAGGYVKELCHVVQFGLECHDRERDVCMLLNFSMSPLPALDDFVNVLQKAAGIRHPLISLPRSLLLGVSYSIDSVSKAFGIKQPISPVRVRKLFSSASVDPKRLRELGYQWKCTLDEAFIDWKHDLPSDFARQVQLRAAMILRHRYSLLSPC